MNAGGRPGADSSSGGVVRFLIVEDQALVGESVGRALESLGDLAFVGIASSVGEAMELAKRLAPDVIVADLSLDDHLAFDLPPLARGLGIPVMFLTGLASDDTAARAIDAGACGFVSKDEPLERLAATVRHVARGGIALVGNWRYFLRPSGGPSNREREVLAGLVTGLANKEIAAAMGIRERTVESHIRRMFDRYGTTSRVQLAVLALKQGWVTASAAPLA